jgi:diaminopimelate epimerase
MHGCGNDFLVLDGPAQLGADRVRSLCDRRRGIGADGILVIGEPDGQYWPVTLHNADGSLGESCGNGARCVARYLLDRHGGDWIGLRFAGGDVKARRDESGIAIRLTAPVVGEFLLVQADGHQYDCHRVSVGNPHLVALVERDPGALDLHRFASVARAAAGDVNVEVAHVRGPDSITLRVDERGVGETLACGTGACATVAAATREHALADAVRIGVPGGQLIVRPGSEQYELAGPAEYVFEVSLG